MFYKEILIKHFKRVSALLLMMAFVFASSSVYVYSAENMNEFSSETLNTSVQPVNIVSNLIHETTHSNDLVQTSTPANTLPLVQSLTNNAADTALLHHSPLTDSFFEHTVFVGDSLTVGFANYCNTHSNSIATDTTYFLAKESGSAKAAISKNALTTYAKVMPSYLGNVQYIEDSISQMSNIQKAFICYGMNDLVSSTPTQYLSDIKTLIQRITDKNPDLTIYVISVPCIVEDIQTGNLSNEAIQNANTLLEYACRENGWGFVNLAEYLMNENMAIRLEYSSDGYVHQNSAAYEIWEKVLKNYAYEETEF